MRETIILRGCAFEDYTEPKIDELLEPLREAFHAKNEDASYFDFFKWISLQLHLRNSKNAVIVAMRDPEYIDE